MKDNIKGLYFKLSMENPRDKEIFDFFDKGSKYFNTNKLDLLYTLCHRFNEDMDACLEVLQEDL